MSVVVKNEELCADDRHAVVRLGYDRNMTTIVAVRADWTVRPAIIPQPV